MKTVNNSMKMTLAGLSRNESLARICVAAFAAQLDPTVEEINDIKAAVSEAVTNCIVHGYRDTVGEIGINLKIIGEDILYIRISDKGTGIADVGKAMEPMFTTCPDEERAGLGFSGMQSFTDSLKVRSAPGKGTTVTMTKALRRRGQNGQTDR